MENNENDRGFKSLENKIADGYYSTNENDGQEEVCQVKFDGDTIWKVKSKLKYGEVTSKIHSGAQLKYFLLDSMINSGIRQLPIAVTFLAPLYKSLKEYIV